MFGTTACWRLLSTPALGMPPSAWQKPFWISITRSAVSLGSIATSNKALRSFLTGTLLIREQLAQIWRDTGRCGHGAEAQTVGGHYSSARGWRQARLLPPS